jgi:hypothetical protein
MGNSRGARSFDSLSLWKRAGERALAQHHNHNLAAGFSPQAVLDFFAASTALKESTSGSSQ